MIPVLTLYKTGILCVDLCLEHRGMVEAQSFIHTTNPEGITVMSHKGPTEDDDRRLRYAIIEVISRAKHEGRLAGFVMVGEADIKTIGQPTEDAILVVAIGQGGALKGAYHLKHQGDIVWRGEENLLGDDCVLASWLDEWAEGIFTGG